jgi:hypothetical protein
MKKATPCPISGEPAQEVPPFGGAREFESPSLGGRYAISGSAMAIWPTLDDAQRDLLRGWIEEQRRAGPYRPLVTTYALQDLGIIH